MDSTMSRREVNFGFMASIVAADPPPRSHRSAGRCLRRQSDARPARTGHAESLRSHEGARAGPAGAAATRAGAIGPAAVGAGAIGPAAVGAGAIGPAAVGAGAIGPAAVGATAGRDEWLRYVPAWHAVMAGLVISTGVL